MHALRKFLYWIFAITAVSCFQISFTLLIRTLQMPSDARVGRAFLVPTGFALMTGVFTAAWWTVWKRKPSGRVWGVAASLINIATGLWPFVMWPHDVFSGFGILGALSAFGLVTAIGVAGLVVFLRREQPPEPVIEGAGIAKIPGDGTSPLLNKAASVLILIGYSGAWWWCGRWISENAVPTGQMTILLIFIAGSLLTPVHELGHTVTGLALGMKLRLFLAGPFHWQLDEGKWKFKFDLKGILADTGGTGLVPTTATQPGWHDVCVTLAGPLTNLFLGLVALVIAFTVGPDSPLQSQGFLVLFGAFNLVCFVTNLLPLRMGMQYSDGARIYQRLSGGPWADFYRSVSGVTSSLVTPLRPRDYNIDAIQRASAGIHQGAQGMLLRLYAYSFYLDRGRMAEARDAFDEAGRIYHDSASDIRAELYTVFVFGAAYVQRDASAARAWWDRMQAKKPTRFNVDYWRAKAALDWIEDHPADANVAWQKSDDLARQLPHAGAYEFDRSCCLLLRQAMDEAAVAG